MSVEPCCPSAVTSAVPVNDPNNNSADENNSNSAFQHCCSSVITSVVPVNDLNDNSAGKNNANPAEMVSQSPNKRQQVADQKPKPSRNRYDTAPVTLPNDALLSRSPHRHNPDAARGVLVDQTHFQQVLDTTEFKDVRKKPVRFLPSSSKLETSNMFNILRSRTAKRVAMIKQSANALLQTQVNGKVAKDTATQQPPTTKQRSPSRTSKHARGGLRFEV